LSNIDLSGIDFNKYLIIKHEDIYKYTSQEDQIDLSRILKNIREGRSEDSKSTSNKYFVINVDESYAEDVVEILRKNNHWS